MARLINIISNRNTILMLSVILGLLIGDLAFHLKKFTIFVLAVVMTFSTTGLDFRSLFPLKRSSKIMVSATVLNYLAGSTIIILLSYLFIKDVDLFHGMAVIGASPPGVAVIPFSLILNGDLRYSIIGIFGTYLAAIVVAPVIILLFTSGTMDAVFIFLIMVKIILIPFLISRLLRIKKLYPLVEKIRGRVVDIGFALIIYIAVGLNSHVFFRDLDILLLISSILVVSTFGLGFFYEFFFGRCLKEKKKVISRTLLLTVKSSGFTAATSLALFGKKAAIPSAILSVVILAYLLFLSFRQELRPTH